MDCSCSALNLTARDCEQAAKKQCLDKQQQRLNSSGLSKKRIGELGARLAGTPAHCKTRCGCYAVAGQLTPFFVWFAGYTARTDTQIHEGERDRPHLFLLAAQLLSFLPRMQSRSLSAFAPSLSLPVCIAAPLPVAHPLPLTRRAQEGAAGAAPDRAGVRLGTAGGGESSYSCLEISVLVLPIRTR